MLVGVWSTCSSNIRPARSPSRANVRPALICPKSSNKLMVGVNPSDNPAILFIGGINCAPALNFWMPADTSLGVAIVANICSPNGRFLKLSCALLMLYARCAPKLSYQFGLGTLSGHVPFLMYSTTSFVRTASLTFPAN